jgi:LmbE family N-acetylglucosaminyl deacetylase
MAAMSAATQSLVFVHAHPDDEALLTAGTMARAASEGHRVVLVIATDGAAGLTSEDFQEGLGETRLAEAGVSAAALGVARTVSLGYQDSGLHGENADGFAHVDRSVVARRIAEICDEEDADVLVGYDSSGGYGHPDHLQVHHTVRAARNLCARRPNLFEATLPREPIVRAARLAASMHLTPDEFSPDEFDSAWTPRAEISHRVNVRKHLPAKDAALRAHASQAAADGTTRTLAVLTRLPRAAQALILGTEYYVVVSARQRAKTSSRSPTSS